MGGDAIRSVSAPVCSEGVRYDGGHKLDRYLRETLGAFVEWVPVCPEVECGLPIPREAMRLVGTRRPRLVTTRTGVDHTAGMRAWAARRLDALEREELCGFIFKSRSPSSGMRQIKVYAGRATCPSSTGVGIFARAFMERFPLLPVEEDGRLNDPALRENFIERIFVSRAGSGPARGRRGRGAGGLPRRPQAAHAVPQPEALLAARETRGHRRSARLPARGGRGWANTWRPY